MRFFLIGVAIGFFFILIFINLSLSSRSNQPLLFNHKIHKKADIDCIQCHPFYKEQRFSGMPNITICIECHKDPLTQNPEEEKIRQFHKSGKDFQWNRIYKQPDHVFFSHRRHVVLGEIDCINCHGPIGESEKPPKKTWVKMNMKWCMDCHTKRKANNDCMACHV